jgi:hypothetical protein
MVRHGASHKIKCFKVLLYTRSKAKTRFDFGKDQGLAREQEKKRVTPEFGERKEEKKFYPQIQGVTVVGGRLTISTSHSRTASRDGAWNGSSWRIMGILSPHGQGDSQMFALRAGPNPPWTRRWLRQGLCLLRLGC